MAGIGGASGGQQPGYVDPFSLGVLAQNTQNAEQAVHNRYAQLGLSGGIGPGAAAGAAQSGQNLQYQMPGLPERMDIGTAPSQVGGVLGESAATLGQMETNANQAVGQGATSGKGNAAISSLGSMLGAV